MTYKTILVTGAKGFIGKHLVDYLLSQSYEVLCYDVDNTNNDLIEYLKKSDFVFHLAGVNRPQNPSEFYKGNTDLTKIIITLLNELCKNPPILFSSSIQAELDNDYGKSKKQAEVVLDSYKGKCFIYRLPNVYGPGCRPNYNSAIATFANNLNKGLPIRVEDPSRVLSLVYVGDVVRCFVRHLQEDNTSPEIAPVEKITLGELVGLFEELAVDGDFLKKLKKNFLFLYHLRDL